MLEIKRSKNYHGYDQFDIITDSGTFEISYEGNEDLYWRYVYYNSIDKEPDFKSFIITKENYFLYNLFEQLYLAIKDKKPYLTFSKEIIPDNEKKINCYANYELYKNKTITWYSDDFAKFENASSFIIKKCKDYYIVLFTKSKTEKDNCIFFPTYSVRIRNSGSRYEPFNISFMGMYHNLKKYNPQYHQIHIEEYLYKKRILKK